MTPLEIALAAAKRAADDKAAAEQRLLDEWEATKPQLEHARHLARQVYEALQPLDNSKYLHPGRPWGKPVYLKVLYHPGTIPKDITREFIDGSSNLFNRWGPCVVFYPLDRPHQGQLPYQQVAEVGKHLYHAWVFWERKYRRSVRTYSFWSEDGAAWDLTPDAAAAWLAERIGPRLVIDGPPPQPPQPPTRNLDIPQ